MIKPIPFFFLLLVLMAMSSSLLAQPTCSGSLGENIFTDGDFGSGLDNIVLSDPGIAPGYIYTTTPPPDDGFYVITNNTALWGYIWSSWLSISDNSTDPNGYMMVVNASDEPGVFFIQEITGLCENTTYEFSADMINLVNSSTTNHILPNISFFIDGDLAFNTGNIPQDEVWHTFGFVLATGPNQNSLELSLRNNAPGGFGNDLALDNISFKACGPNLGITAGSERILCEGNNMQTIEVDIPTIPVNSFVQWQVSVDQGVTWTDIIGENELTLDVMNLLQGNYMYRYVYAQSAANLLNEKCQIFSSELELEVQSLLTPIIDTLCLGAIYEIGVSIYDQSGAYRDTLTGESGCDSIVILDLFVVDNDVELMVSATNPTCFESIDGIIDIDAVNGSLDSDIILTLNEEPIDISSFPYFTGSGVYVIEATDRYGCMATEEITLIDPIEFTVDAFEDVIVDLGQSTVLTPQSTMFINRARWQGEHISCDTCITTTVSPVNSTSITGQFWSVDDCLAEVEIDISVRKLRSVYIPNIFTPNDDGLNDAFTVFGDQNIVEKVTSFRVFNRWGNQVFNGANMLLGDESQGWDGTFKGQDILPGVFIYAITIVFIDGVSIDYHGTVTVLP